MSYHAFYKQLEQNARKYFPGLSPGVTWDYIISPIELRLSPVLLQKAQAAIRAFWAVSRRSSYRALLEPVPGISDREPKHHSVLMAYDFHSDDKGDLSLVEINTNASGYLLGSLMEMTHDSVSLENYQPLQELRSSFENELKLWGQGSGTPHIAITDEDIPHQKMLVEFEMYRAWFESLGWTAEFREPQEFKVGTRLEGSRPVDLVYNRLTDFYFEDPANAALREAHAKNLACISPNPYEYWALADKQRLVQLGDEEFLRACGASEEEKAAIAAVLIPTFDKSHFGSPDEIWSQRKNLFFKPKRSHGGKSVYRGESVSRKVFERLMMEDILIQRFRPAPHVPTDDPRSVLSNWKFDLRFFVYEDRIQLAAARIYQGQVTNFSSAMGGFTLVRF